ncbi:mitochondrial 54S ribosomal protein uL23m [Drepanopeziza brunnea f. sp. 'multigermtubi']|uniref:Large ribosomal subunit protein uL23m n=1 Tax=Marssonina brunnea f. sp. multigermtubi (strain MB_m1) TaxID=1072389 RepID=K1WXZ7_MARBU|nr:uncharacterized protein MBM_04313 [Drepanopeziza brunnea f. sp. 'multigermtubi' MB_m1]EKD17452.1 hypothetical protein MBM_04313 [Drepanopeziza brunnea f. sp. 'multigermtubi' MB_m1]KAJ5042512.1 hypothetical protein L3040_005055 [Drepanopeziza brunnea f. sp. 'multigermtubi']
MNRVPTRAGRFRLGTKEIYLPNFTLTLLRTPELPPTTASFEVPLNLNKLDIRDYLWNVYGVQVLGVRSYIQQQKVRQDKPGAQRVAQRKWYRPRAIKRMLVEMEKPFVWPAEPENFDPWDKKTFDAAKKDREQTSEVYNPEYRLKPARDRESIAEQAKSLLKGETTWQSDPYSTRAQRNEWVDDGEPVEVDQHVEVPKLEKV